VREIAEMKVLIADLERNPPRPTALLIFSPIASVAAPAALSRNPTH
jgi:hypothetical protein